jgi:CCR4-NOT transcription complex subunit 4
MLSGLISKGRMLMIRGLDDELLSMDEVTTSVDALVSDDTFDQVREASWLTQNPATVSAPPGFDVLQTPESSHASPQGPNRLTPALPKVPPPGLPQRTATPEQSQRAVSKESKKSAKETILAKAAAGSALQEEDFPALDAPRSQKQASVPPSTPTPKATPVSKKAQRAKAKEEARVEENKVEEKVEDAKVEEKVEVPPVKTKEKAKAPPAAKAKPAEPSAAAAEPPAVAAAFPPLPAPSVASPARAHKTLRVVPTAKIEVPPIGSPVSAVSRAISHRPDTPVSELISDTASIVSASVSASRAGSPPPPTSRIGAAAVRSTTKSQQRKQRKDALKQDTQAIVETAKEEPEEHAPVLGRKKKQKKEKAPKAVPKPAPAPKPVVVEEKKKQEPEEKKKKKKPEVIELEPPAAKKGKDKEPEVQEKPAEPPKQP